MSRRALAAAVAVHLLLAGWFVVNPDIGAAPWQGFPLDDAWIHLVYGRAFLHTGLPAFNEGDLQTGFSSPLQVVVTAAAHVVAATGVPIAVALKGFGLAFSCVAIVLVGLLAEALGAPAWLAAGLLAISPTWAFSALSGMEVTLAGACMAAACLARVRGRPGAAGIALALGCLARPECVGMLPVVLLLGGLRTGTPARQGRSGGTTLAVLLGPSAVALGAWASVCMAISDHPLPATMYAKAQPFALPKAWIALASLTDTIPAVGIGAGPVLLLLAVTVAAHRREALLLVLTPPAWIAGLAVKTMLGGDPRWFYFLRYQLPPEPLFVVAMALGVRTRRWPYALAALAALADVVDLPTRREQYGMNCLNIEEMNVTVGRWLAEHTPPDAVIATVDAGAVRYFSDRRTLDVLGLNQFQVLPFRSRLLTDPAAMAAWMASEGCDWLVTFPKALPFTLPAAHPEAWFTQAAAVHSDHYTVIAEPQDTIAVLHRTAPSPEPGAPAALEAPSVPDAPSAPAAP